MNFIKLKGNNEEEYFINLNEVELIGFHGFDSTKNCYHIGIRFRNGNSVQYNLDNEQNYLCTKNEFLNFYKQNKCDLKN